MDTAANFLGRLPLGRGWNLDGARGLLHNIRSYLPAEQIEVVRRAYEFGAQAHSGQKRMSGERYISHPVAVASILADLHLDYHSIVAAILHDVVEDTPTALENIVEEFGEEVAQLVDGVSKLDRIQFKSKAEAQAESLRKMMLAMAQDVRVILLKLADRLHNMRTLGPMPQEKRRRIARETLEIYAPMANRLGINDIRLELEDLGFRYLYPTRYQVIEKNLRESMGGQKRVVKRISVKIKKSLVQNHITAEVIGRKKHIYSVYQKMKRKELSLEEVADVFGFRIVVEDADLCYRVLGVIHRTFRPIIGRFKDYIAIPRVNGYQSLHTTLVGPKGMPLEFQIRTRDMDNFANSGIAAHWLYKTDQTEAVAPQARAREWLNSLVDFQQDTNSEEFLESVKIDLFPDKVYVFTPKGDILRLPRGATAVDFAYMVHTDIGNRCVSARIDRRRLPLHTVLKNGQTVTIKTARDAHPNPAWMNFVVTAKARSAIRSYLKNLRQGDAIKMGRRLLDNALTEFRTKIRKIPIQDLNDLLEDMSLESAESLYEEIGLGHQLAPIIARRLYTKLEPDTAGEEEATGTNDGPVGLTISGTEDMVVSFGKCCYPVPGDSVMGHLSSGRGLVVHRRQCGNLGEFRKQPEKWINITWEKDISQQFLVAIEVEALDQVGMLASIAARISNVDSNIAHVEFSGYGGDASSMKFSIWVTDTDHLRRVIKQIDGMPDVLSVERVIAS